MNILAQKITNLYANIFNGKPGSMRLNAAQLNELGFVVKPGEYFSEKEKQQFWDLSDDLATQNLWITVVLNSDEKEIMVIHKNSPGMTSVSEVTLSNMESVGMDSDEIAQAFKETLNQV